jgi:hypothetical protein
MRYHLANNFFGENDDGDTVELWDVLDTLTNTSVFIGTYEECQPVVTKANIEWCKHPEM